MNKKNLRSLYLKKRMNISFEEKKVLEDKMLLFFQTLFFDSSCRFFLSYCSIQEKNEIDLSLMEKYLQTKIVDITKCYPVVDFEKDQIKTIGVNKDTIFKKNHWNIMEPTNGTLVDKKKLDIIITPMLIFDENGFRVGYGKGMYDKLFSMCKKEVLKIGFCFFEPIEKIEDRQSYDISLDIIITPEKIFRFNS